MSVEAVHWALKQTTDEAVDKLILIAMANYADETHSSWPSRKKLAAAGMCSVDTVDRANKRLEARNLIRKSSRAHRSGANSSNFYELNVDGGWPHHAAPLAAPCAPPQPHPDAAPLAAPGCGYPSRIGCGHKEPSLEPSLETAPLPPSDGASAASGQKVSIDREVKGGERPSSGPRPSIRIRPGDVGWTQWLEAIESRLGEREREAAVMAGEIRVSMRWPTDETPMPAIARVPS